MGAGAGAGVLYNGGAGGVYKVIGSGTFGPNGGHTWNVNTYAGKLIITAPIGDGAGFAFTKGGTGTLVLNGTESYGDAWTVGAGEMDLGDGTTGNFSASTASYTVTSGASLGIGFASGSLSGNISSSGTVYGNEASGVTDILTGTLTGSGSLIQNGAGTTVLTAGLNSGGPYFTGAVIINAGAISLANATAIGYNQVGHTTTGVLVNSGGALQMQGGITTAGAYALTLNGAGVTLNPRGALESVSGANTYTGAITLGSASTIGSDAGASLTASGAIVNGFGLTTVGSGSTTLSGAISGAGGLTVNDGASGVTTLSGGAGNTYLGQTIVSGGELDLGKTSGYSIIGATAAPDIAHPDILVSGGTLKFLAGNQLANTIDTSGHVTLAMTSGAVNLNGTAQTVYAFQNSGGTFTTGAGTLTGTGATITFSGGTNTVNTGGNITDSHFVISGGTNTIQEGGVLSLQSGTSSTGIVPVQRREPHARFLRRNPRHDPAPGPVWRHLLPQLNLGQHHRHHHQRRIRGQRRRHRSQRLAAHRFHRRRHRARRSA